MANDVIMMLRLPKALKKQIEAEAKGYDISTSELIRKKLQAVSLPHAPVVRLLRGRVMGKSIMRVEVPLSDVFLKGWKKVGRKVGVP